MAGFRQNDGRSRHRIVPVSAHKRVAHMHVLNGLKVLNRNYFAQRARLHDFTQFFKVRRIAEHVADGYNSARFFRHVQDVSTLFLRGGNRLFKENMVAHLERFHTRTIMQIIRGGDDNRIRELRSRKHLLPGSKPVLLGNAVLFGIAFISNGNGLRDTHNVQLLGKLYRIVSIDVATVACPTGNRSNRPFGQASLVNFGGDNQGFTEFIFSPCRQGQHRAHGKA